MTYKDLQCQRVETLIHQTDVFDGDPGEDHKCIRKYDYMLRDGQNNLFKPYRAEMISYMANNGAAWWGGGGPPVNPLSSQAACLNHLFPFREDAEAVLAIARKISPDIVAVLPIETDRYAPAYIQFEAVSDEDHLNEGCVTRGSNCTSLDALIYAVHKDGRKLLLPIEWKYTEVYGDENKAEGTSGQTRKGRYDGLMKQSRQLLAAPKEPSVYYFEPFYQLMRQTLWAEQMIAHGKTEEPKGAYRETAAFKGIQRDPVGQVLAPQGTAGFAGAHGGTEGPQRSQQETAPLKGIQRETGDPRTARRDTEAQGVAHPIAETLRADDFIHVHVVPCGNGELLRRPFACSGKTLETTWRAQLSDQSKYWLVCPEFLLSQINGKKYGEVFRYLQARYW